LYTEDIPNRARESHKKFYEHLHPEFGFRNSVKLFPRLYEEPAGDGENDGEKKAA
jgi:hypothetical protein